MVLPCPSNFTNSLNVDPQIPSRETAEGFIPLPCPNHVLTDIEKTLIACHQAGSGAPTRQPPSAGPPGSPTSPSVPGSPTSPTPPESPTNPGSPTAAQVITDGGGDSSSSTTVTVVIVVIVLLAAGAVGGFLFIRHRNKSKREHDELLDAGYLLTS